MLRDTEQYQDVGFDSASTTVESRATVASLLTTARDHLQQDQVTARSFLERAAALLDDVAPGPQPKAAPWDYTVRGGLAPWQMKRVWRHVAEHLAEPIAVDDLAALCRLSASHFSRAFKVSFGAAPHAYIVGQRIGEAKRLMLESRESLSQIAFACGFADQSHFCRHFRRAEGCSPNLWRRSYERGPAPVAAE